MLFSRAVMPFCHLHRVPLLIDLYGNPTCERCERTRKADEALHGNVVRRV
jgi:hypothetical protein